MLMEIDCNSYSNDKNMEELKLSVIIPVYNVEKYIDKCIESVLMQTEEAFEVILVDDGSTDSSGEKCDAYARQDKRIKVIHKENGGLMSAWMCGLKNANCEYIVFVDSDDWIGSHMLEKMWETREKYDDIDMVICQFCHVDRDVMVKENFLLSAGYYDSKKIKEDLFPIFLNAGGFQERAIPISRCGKLIKRSLIVNNLKYCNLNVSYQEDLSIIFPAILDCKAMALLDENDCEYFYRKTSFSILHSYNAKMYEQIGVVYFNLKKVCIDKKHTEFEKQIKADYLAAMVQCYKNELMNPLGFGEIKRKIDKITCDEDLKISIREIEWRDYRKLNVLIIVCLEHWNGFTRNIVTFFLYILKQNRIKKLERTCKYS